MGNALSYLVLVLAFPVGIGMFLVLRPPLAAVVVFLSFTMFLPEKVALDAPGLPGIGKAEMISLACLFGLLLRGRRRMREARWFRGPEALVLLLLVGDAATVLTNQDPLDYGPTHLPGLGLNEVVSLFFNDFMWYAVPFFVARALITNARELKMLLTALVVAGAVYTPFLFIELMMSPQMHNWIYGFAQHAFDQTVRGGGYRPMVFMAHGLAVALLMAWSVMAALTLAKARRAVAGMPAPVTALYNAGFLAACKSTGAFLYAAAAAPLLLFRPPRTIARVVALLGVLVVAYPALRAAAWFPTAALVDAATSISAERAQSLAFRFEMEELLSDRAAERPWFGWGRFGRNMVHDPESGRPVSVSDGHWIIAYGVKGMVGFAGIFLLIVWPLFGLRRRLARIEEPADRTLLCGLAVIVATSAVDLIPNGMFTTLTVFLAGALFGAGRGMVGSVLASAPATVASEAQ